MATIQRRKDSTGKVRYRVQIRLRGYPPQTATFKRKTDAERWASATESAMRENRYFQVAEARKHTISEMIRRYTKEHLSISGLRTIKDRERHLKWWDDQIGDLTLADMTPALLSEQRAKLLHESGVGKAAISPATANRYMASFSHTASIASREWGWIDSSPFQKIAKLREPRGRVRFLTDEERKNLLKECEAESETLYAVVVVALSTGARQGEIMNLRWGDIDFSREFMRLTETKNNERRAIPLKGYAYNILRERAKVRNIATDLVFPSRVKPSTPLRINQNFRAAVQRAGITDFRFHDLRHTAASYLAMNGATLAEIAEVLGHKTLQMVKRYAHLSEAHTAGVVASMNEKIFG